MVFLERSEGGCVQTSDQLIELDCSVLANRTHNPSDIFRHTPAFQLDRGDSYDH